MEFQLTFDLPKGTNVISKCFLNWLYKGVSCRLMNRTESGQSDS